MRAAYHEALENTRLDVVRLGALASDAINSAVAALEERDADLAARVIAGDDEIDALRRTIEANCARHPRVSRVWGKRSRSAGRVRTCGSRYCVPNCKRKG